MSPYQQAHVPAMTLQEAAMLPAQTNGIETAQSTADTAAETGYSFGRPGRLLMPRREADFIPVETEVTADVETVTTEASTASSRRGSVAGRSVLRAAGISMPGIGCMSRSYYQIPPDAWDGCNNLCWGCCQPCWGCPGYPDYPQHPCEHHLCPHCGRPDHDCCHGTCHPDHHCW